MTRPRVRMLFVMSAGVLLAGRLMLGAPAAEPGRFVQGAAAASAAPKLEVILVVDQMRGDYIDKFQHQWTGGLHRLVTEGAWFRQANYPYANTVTCVGHSTIGTGSFPSTHGMILNAWYDRAKNKQVACTDDPSVASVSYGKPLPPVGESAFNMRAPTLAEELSAQLDPRARVAAFSLKARSAVTLVGHHADAIAWFDDAGAWETSTAYSKAPVAAVADFIKSHPIELDFARVWTPSLAPDAYFFESPAVGVTAGKGTSNALPHVLKGASAQPDAAYYSNWQSSPFSDEYLGQMAAGVAEKMNFGKTRSTDFLAVSFSALDRVGHEFGPNSHEVQDVLVRLDHTIGDLLQNLDRVVGRGNYTVALSADHGVAPIPERAVAEGLDAGRASATLTKTAIEHSLSASFGSGTYVKALVQTEAYLTPDAWARLRADPAAIARLKAELATVPGVLTMYTRDEIQGVKNPDDAYLVRESRSFDAERSGELSVVLKPYWMYSGSGTTHGTGYAYDTHVPVVLMGRGIKPGEYLTAASPADIAPTFAMLAGVTLPRAQGRVLAEALLGR